MKFEELYDEASQYIDDLAERILAIGGKPIGTLKESLNLSIIDEAGKNYTAEEMVAELSQDFSNVVKQLEKSIEVTSNAEDDVTEDLFIEMKTNIEKHNWTLKSYLNN